MTTELQETAAYEARIENADTLQELQAIADDMIGNHEGYEDCDTETLRDHLEDFVKFWLSDSIRMRDMGEWSRGE